VSLPVTTPPAPHAAAPWRALYPFASHRHELPDWVGMHYLDEGPRRDEAVLCLHGNPTWSFYYREVVQALREHRRVVVPDHVGMGLSDRPAQYPYRLERRIADVESLVAALGLRKVHLVVHDWGGAIGLGWARRHPARVGRIVILNTAAFPDPRLPWRIAICRVPLLGALLVRGLNGFAGAAVHLAVTRPLPPAVRAGLLAPYRSWATRLAVHRFVQDIPMGPSHPSYRELMATHRAIETFRDRPTLILWGGRDFCFHDGFLARWRELLPAAEVRHFPRAGHYVLEDARDEVVPAIAGWLAP
jgi:pimeloyl-ACP methyl ester carboxylesterase